MPTRPPTGGAPQHRNFCVSVLLLAKGKGGMRERNNLNRQDTILGGMILGGFVVIAVIAALFTLVSWRGERTADVPKTTVGSSAHAWTPAAPAAPSANW
jgi:hypothetical protein